MNKTKLVLLTAATLLAITSGAEAARVKRAKPSFLVRLPRKCSVRLPL